MLNLQRENKRKKVLKQSRQSDDSEPKDAFPLFKAAFS